MKGKICEHFLYSKPVGAIAHDDGNLPRSNVLKTPRRELSRAQQGRQNRKPGTCAKHPLPRHARREQRCATQDEGAQPRRSARSGPTTPTSSPPTPQTRSCLGPSGVHGNYFKGRRRSYAAYVQCGSEGESEDDWDCGPDSDDPHSDAYGD